VTCGRAKATSFAEPINSSNGAEDMKSLSYRPGPSGKAMLLLAGAIVAMVALVESAAAQDADVPFTHVIIDANPPDRPYYKMAGDLDGDGDLDVLVGGAQGPLVWYANPTWHKTQIAEGGWDGVNGEVADLDGDGDADIIMGGVVWFRNPRVGGGSWKMVRIARQRAHDVEVGDLDLDGRLDVVARDQSAFGKAGNAIYVYHQENPQSWNAFEIPCPHGEGLKLGDIDRDGDADILIGGQWFENTRGTAAGAWKRHVYTSAWTEPDTKVEMADFNGDGRADIVLTPAELRGETYKVAWYEAPSEPKTQGWLEHVIVPSIECVIHSLGVGDFDNDGDVDVALAEMHQGADPDEVSILLNGGKGETWRKQVLSDRGSHDIVVADLDNDGDPDIVGANHAGVHPLELWRNDSKP
jgi:hypothetical protein